MHIDVSENATHNYTTKVLFMRCRKDSQISSDTFSASFLSLFIALNCFILVRTALSIGLSDASPPSLIHGCSIKARNFVISVGDYGAEKFAEPKKENKCRGKN